jgi:hypothetical protein
MGYDALLGLALANRGHALIDFGSQVFPHFCSSARRDAEDEITETVWVRQGRQVHDNPNAQKNQRNAYSEKRDVNVTSDGNGENRLILCPWRHGKVCLLHNSGTFDEIAQARGVAA